MATLTEHEINFLLILGNSKLSVTCLRSKALVLSSLFNADYHSQFYESWDSLTQKQLIGTMPSEDFESWLLYATPWRSANSFDLVENPTNKQLLPLEEASKSLKMGECLIRGIPHRVLDFAFMTVTNGLPFVLYQSLDPNNDQILIRELVEFYALVEFTPNE